LIAKIDGLINEKNPKGEGLQELLFAKSSLYFRSDKKKEAEKLLREAKKLAPESKIGKRIDDILSRFFGTKDSS